MATENGGANRSEGKTGSWIEIPAPETIPSQPKQPGFLSRAGHNLLSACKKTGEYLSSIDDNDIGILVGAAVIYGVVTGVGTFVFHSNVDTDIKNATYRNMDSFNQVAEIQHLNAAERGDARWATRQNDITYGIRSGDHKWNWFAIGSSKGGDKLLDIFDRANIALLPRQEMGIPASLTVDSRHGCLLVNHFNTDTRIKDDARALLKAFGDRGAPGVYTITNGPANAVSFAPLEQGMTADSICPAARTPAPVKSGKTSTQNAAPKAEKTETAPAVN